jgi:hypothetical protein
MWWYIRNSARIIRYWSNKEDCDSGNFLVNRIGELLAVFAIAISCPYLTTITTQVKFDALWVNMVMDASLALIFGTAGMGLACMCMYWLDHLKQARAVLDPAPPVLVDMPRKMQ